jgi:hypothetical protein
MIGLVGVHRDHDLLLFRLPAKDEVTSQLVCDVQPVVRMDKLDRSTTEADLLRSEMDKLAKGLEHLFIPRSFLPGEGAAAIRVLSSLHPDLIPVVDRRGSGEGEQERRGEDESAHIPVGKGEKTWFIVAPKEGVGGVVPLIGVTAPDTRHITSETGRIPVFFGEEGDERLPQLGVHHPVERSVLEPRGGEPHYFA